MASQSKTDNLQSALLMIKEGEMSLFRSRKKRKQEKRGNSRNRSKGQDVPNSRGAAEGRLQSRLQSSKAIIPVLLVVDESDSGDALWFSCDICDKWYHAECTNVSPDDYSSISTMDWYCGMCVNWYIFL